MAYLDFQNLHLTRLHEFTSHMNHQVEALCFLASNNLHHYLHSFRNLRHYYKKTTTTTTTTKIKKTNLSKTYL